MQLDITTLTGAGFAPYYAEWVDHGVSSINGLHYKSKYLYHTFSDVTNNLTVRFEVERTFEDGTKENYFYDSIADSTTSVDKMGNIVAADSPSKWGTEIERTRVLFSAYGPGLSNANILG